MFTHSFSCILYTVPIYQHLNITPQTTENKPPIIKESSLGFKYTASIQDVNNLSTSESKLKQVVTWTFVILRILSKLIFSTKSIKLSILAASPQDPYFSVRI